MTLDAGADYGMSHVNASLELHTRLRFSSPTSLIVTGMLTMPQETLLHHYPLSSLSRQEPCPENNSYVFPRTRALATCCQLKVTWPRERGSLSTPGQRKK
jgi:hypothetical protein